MSSFARPPTLGRMTDPSRLVDVSTIGGAIARAMAAYDDLATLGQEIEDEWTYIDDLAGSWHARMSEVADARGDAPIPDEIDRAITAATDLITRIKDPHRAIDWLSTFPAVVLTALGERP
jgi:hypothetical protein